MIRNILHSNFFSITIAIFLWKYQQKKKSETIGNPRKVFSALFHVTFGGMLSVIHTDDSLCEVILSHYKYRTDNTQWLFAYAIHAKMFIHNFFSLLLFREVPRKNILFILNNTKILEIYAIIVGEVCGEEIDMEIQITMWQYQIPQSEVGRLKRVTRFFILSFFNQI
jgi:hypothetical protein